MTTELALVLCSALLRFVLGRTLARVGKGFHHVENCVAWCNRKIGVSDPKAQSALQVRCVACEATLALPARVLLPRPLSGGQRASPAATHHDGCDGIMAPRTPARSSSAETTADTNCAPASRPQLVTSRPGGPERRAQRPCLGSNNPSQDLGKNEDSRGIEMVLTNCNRARRMAQWRTAARRGAKRRAAWPCAPSGHRVSPLTGRSVSCWCRRGWGSIRSNILTLDRGG